MKKRTRSESKTEMIENAYIEAEDYRKLSDENADEIVAMGYRLTRQMVLLRVALMEK